LAAAASTKTASREAAARDESLGKGFIWNFSSSDFAGGSFWATEKLSAATRLAQVARSHPLGEREWYQTRRRKILALL
jgi:hypothetical protein